MLRHAGRAALPCVGSVTSSLLRSRAGQDCGCALKAQSLEERHKLLFDLMAKHKLMEQLWNPTGLDAEIEVTGACGGLL